MSSPIDSIYSPEKKTPIELNGKKYDVYYCTTPSKLLKKKVPIHLHTNKIPKSDPAKIFFVLVDPENNKKHVVTKDEFNCLKKCMKKSIDINEFIVEMRTNTHMRASDCALMACNATKLIPKFESNTPTAPKIEDENFRTMLDVMKPDTVLSLTRTNAVRAAHFFVKEMQWIKDKYKKEVRVVTAESLTAGMIMSTLVDIPNQGWSKYGCFGVYETSAKERFLGVSVRRESWKNIDKNEDTGNFENAVYTHRCAAQMAIGALIRSYNPLNQDTATFAIAVTGQAMPTFLNENTLGKVHIGYAIYIDDDNRVADYSQCPTKRICVHVIEIDAMEHNPHLSTLWKTRPKNEIRIKKILEKKNKQVPHFIDGFNDVAFTSLVSQISRFTTVATALFYARIFLINLNKHSLLNSKEIQSLHNEENVQIVAQDCDENKPLFDNTPYEDKTVMRHHAWPFFRGDSKFQMH